MKEVTDASSGDAAGAAAGGASRRHPGSVGEVFSAFGLLGLTSFGGPVAHLGYFREEFVGKRRWLTDAEYADVVALCQFLPGPASSQVGMALGWRRAGLPGLLAAFVGFTTPSAVVLALAAVGVAYFRDLDGPIAGLKAAAVAVVILVIIEAQKPEFVYSPLYELYDMFIRLTTASDSSVDRGSALITDLRMFLDHPLLGTKIAPVLHGTNHNTSSTLILFAITGIIGGLLHLATWVALLWKKQRNVFGNLLLLLIFLMSFNTQNLVADVFFWLFPCMTLVERGMPLLTKKEA